MTKLLATTLTALLAATTACSDDIATDAELRERVNCEWDGDPWADNPNNTANGCEAACAEREPEEPDGTCECMVDGVSLGQCAARVYRGHRGYCTLTPSGAVFAHCPGGEP